MFHNFWSFTSGHSSQFLFRDVGKLIDEANLLVRGWINCRVADPKQTQVRAAL